MVIGYPPGNGNSNGNNIEYKKLPPQANGDLFPNFTDPETGEKRFYTPDTITIEAAELAYQEGIITNQESFYKLMYFIAKRDHEIVKNLREKEGLDPLTALSNEVHLDSRLEKSINELNYHNDERYINKLGVIYLQVDLKGLKGFNLNGQAGGNKALREFADLLRATVRDHDMLFRIGGDEFSIILSIEKGDKTDIDSFEAAIQRIKDQLSDVAYIGCSIVKREGKELKIYGAEEKDDFTGITTMSQKLIKIADLRMTENKKEEKGEKWLASLATAESELKGAKSYFDRTLDAGKTEYQITLADGSSFRVALSSNAEKHQAEFTEQVKGSLKKG